MPLKHQNSRNISTTQNLKKEIKTISEYFINAVLSRRTMPQGRSYLDGDY